MAEIFFDNSALSRVVEETEIDRKALVAGLQVLGILRVSSLNVLETARTSSAVLREGKLKFYRSLSRTVAPINAPIEVLAKVARAHHDKTGKIQVGDQYLYNLLANPELATEELRKVLAERADEEEANFKKIFQEMRKRFQPMFTAAPNERFDTEDVFLEFAFTNIEATMGHMVTGAYRDATGADLPLTEVAGFLNAAPAWKTYIAAHLHELWIRAVRETGPGKKKAGAVDTESAVYLNFCDRFITNDRRQSEALHAANKFNPRATAVELYDDLRARLLL